jgi:hypothetical protein
MHGPETTQRLNKEACEGKPPQNTLRHHPRIQALRVVIDQLPVDVMYRAALHRSLELYADQIIERQPDEGWDDLEALQQVTLGDMMEASMQAQFQSRRERP